MTLETIQSAGIIVSALMLLIAMVITGIRIVRGPHAPDRAMALDMLTLLGIAAAGMAVVWTGTVAFMDIALGIALIGFLASVAFAGFIQRGSIEE
jgi:multicomponent Na+:H+ antiporter subunit F